MSQSFDEAATQLLGKEAFQRIAGGMMHQSDLCREIAMKLLAGEIEEPNESLEVVRQVARRQWLALQALHHQDTSTSGSRPALRG